jgi:type I restriction enzyme R subunit
MRIKNILTSFSDFKWEDLKMTEQEFNDFQSKYLDLHQKVKRNHQKEKVSILEDVDFALELIHRDEINVAYIIQLLIKLKQSLLNGDSSPESKAQIMNEINNLLQTQIELRSKRELIEKFIKENLPEIDDTDDVAAAFDQYWDEEQQKAFFELVTAENLLPDKTEKLIEDYLFAERPPLRDEVLALRIEGRPSILKAREIGDRILKRIMDFVETFINGRGE